MNIYETLAKAVKLKIPILADSGIIYTYSDQWDPWGSRRRILIEELERMVDEKDSHL